MNTKARVGAVALLWLAAAAPPLATDAPESPAPAASAPAAPAHRSHPIMPHAIMRRTPGAVGPVVLSARPGSAEDLTARALTARDVAASDSKSEPPLVLVGSARLAGPHAPAALFVQLQSADLCGSAGCSTSVYVNAPGGAAPGGEESGWRRVLDSVSGPIRVAAQHHLGMADLLVSGDDRWVWDGHAYADTVPAPAIDLRHSVAQHRREVARQKG